GSSDVDDDLPVGPLGLHQLLPLLPCPNRDHHPGGLLINAVVLLVLLLALDVCIAAAISLLMIFVCGMATYGASKQHATWIIPFFCYQLFDLVMNTLVAASVAVYPSTVQDYVRHLPENFPYKEEILSVNRVCLAIIVLLFIGCILAFKAYLLACVWNCYKYVSGRRNTEVLVYVTTNDTT
ncbi:lysosomal-associated transmembrane protein 4B-like, partial [Scleropages formosus]